MIHIIDDWYVTVEPSPVNYVVRRGEGKKDKKGAWDDNPKGYFKSLSSAIRFIREQVIAEKLSASSRCLPDALRMVSEVDERFEKIMEAVTA